MYSVRHDEEIVSVEADSDDEARAKGAMKLEASAEDVQVLTKRYGVACDELFDVQALTDEQARQEAREKLIERVKNDPESIRMHITDETLDE